MQKMPDSLSFVCDGDEYSSQARAVRSLLVSMNEVVRVTRT